MTKPDFVHLFLEGLDRFNARRFWDAHESWEELWLEAESDVVTYLQGLIQLAAAYHHIQRGTLRGAGRLFDAALQKLEAFPLDFAAVDRSEAEAAARRHRIMLANGEATGADDFPRLQLIHSRSDFLPPRQDW